METLHVKDVKWYECKERQAFAFAFENTVVNTEEELMIFFLPVNNYYNCHVSCL